MAKLLQKLPLLLALLFTIQAVGKPDMDSKKRYHIVCSQFPNGCTADGKSAKATTPLYYLPTASTEDYTFWIIEEQEDGLYTIRNAKTKQYVTYAEAPRQTGGWHLPGGLTPKTSCEFMQRQADDDCDDENY